MNCLEFRRQLLIDPQSSEPEFLRHGATCGDCSREYERALSFEQKLHAVLNADHPPGLESRVLLARDLRLNRWLPSSQRQWLSMAASLLLALGLAFWLGPEWSRPFGTGADLSQAVLQHIQNEPEALDNDRDVDPNALAELFSRFGARITGDLGHVSYAARCNIRRQEGVHLVLPGEKGAVTLLFMPNEHLPDSKSVRSAHFDGVIVPTSYGSLAVIGEKSESVSPILARIQAAVDWDT